MILDAILTILTVLHALVAILLPAADVHDMLALGHHQLSGLDVLTAVGADAALDIGLRFILLVVLCRETLRLDKGDNHLHDQEEEGVGKQCDEQCHENLGDGAACALCFHWPGSLGRSDRVITLTGFRALPLSGIVHCASIALVFCSTIGE